MAVAQRLSMGGLMFLLVLGGSAAAQPTTGASGRGGAGAADPAPAEWEKTPIGAEAEAGPRGPKPSPEDSPDARLAERIAQRLSWDRELARFHFDVRVEQGIVTITGEVATQPQAHRARRIADTTLGVVGVVNAVRSAPKLEMEGLAELPPVDDDTLRHRVLESLSDHPEIDAAGVEVLVQEGRVILDGRIPGFNQSARAERIALGLHGVRSVDNRLAVNEGTR